MSRLKLSFNKLFESPYGPSIRSVLVDGDIFVYTIGFAVEEKFEWPDGREEVAGDIVLAKRLLDNRVRFLRNSIPEGVGFNLVITGDAPNWRKGLDDTYKAGRGRKPVDYASIRKYMRTLASVIETVDGLEADDLLAARASADPLGTVIVSFDKDYFTVPGTFIHLATNSAARMYSITPVQALCFLVYQALAGDPVDGYKGVDKIGPSKASHMLQLCELKGLTIRQAYLLIKGAIKKREREYKGVKSKVDGQSPAKHLWKDFRRCLDLAALTWDGEEPTHGIGLMRVFKYRSERFEYFLPYIDPGQTHEHTKLKL